MIKVDKFEDLEHITAEDFAFVKQENQYYTLRDTGSWTPVGKTEGNVSTIDLGMSQYEVNKNLVRQLPDFTAEDFEAAKVIIKDFLPANESEDYFMLLGREINYYTVFHRSNLFDDTKYSLVDELLACLRLGFDSVRDLHLTADKGALEIWVINQDEPAILYFFNYDGGVIQCK